MESSGPVDVTTLLHRVGAGESGAQRQLYSLVWDELHRIASAHMKRRAADHTLQPTALVNEAWLRLSPSQGSDWSDREHFLSFASRVMRSILVDHARAQAAARRGGGVEPMALDGNVELAVGVAERPVDIVALDEALNELGKEDHDLSRVIELRFFGGLTMEEAARVEGISLSTAERRWRLARMWLRDRLGDVG